MWRFSRGRQSLLHDLQRQSRDEHLLVAGCLATDKLNGASGAIERFGQKFYQRLVSGGIDRRRRDPDLQLIADNFANRVPGRSWLQVNGEQNA